MSANFIPAATPSVTIIEGHPYLLLGDYCYRIEIPSLEIEKIFPVQYAEHSFKQKNAVRKKLFKALCNWTDSRGKVFLSNVSEQTRVKVLAAIANAIVTASAFYLLPNGDINRGFVQSLLFTALKVAASGHFQWGYSLAMTEKDFVCNQQTAFFALLNGRILEDPTIKSIFGEFFSEAEKTLSRSFKIPTTTEYQKFENTLLKSEEKTPSLRVIKAPKSVSSVTSESFTTTVVPTMEELTEVIEVEEVEVTV